MRKIILGMLVLASLALPAAAAVPFATAPINPGAGPRSAWISITNRGPAAISLSSASVYTNGVPVQPTRTFDNCTTMTQVVGAACTLIFPLPANATVVWFAVQASSTTGLRGAMTIVDANLQPVAIIEAH